MKVERFFHIRNPNWMDSASKGGVTIRVTGDTELVGQVDVQHAECSKNDAFCKKTGRELATAAPIKVVPLRFLPQELNRIGLRAVKRKRLEAFASDFTFAIKYFLPKE